MNQVAPLSEGTKAERRLAFMLCAPAVLVLIAVAAWPIAYAIGLSLQRYDLRFPDDHEFVGLDNYVAVLSEGYWWTAFGTTVLITVVSVSGTLAAAAVVITVPMVLFVLFFQRRIVAGLTSGAVKG